MNDSDKRGCLQFLILIFMPAILIAAGAGISGAGLAFEWMWMVWAGLIIAGIGLLWGLVLLFISGEGIF
ncbi:MAG: hypothetical protein MK074_01750 [Phycisphaerales bacterium]|nr:hypothetical protein [Phycisphaerales bacterium]